MRDTAPPRNRVRSRTRRLLALFGITAAIVAFGAALPLPAQSAADDAPRPAPVTLMFMGDLSGEPAPGRVRDVVFERLRDRLDSFGFDLGVAPVFVHRPESTDLDLIDVRIGSTIGTSVSNEIDLVVAAFYRLDGDQLAIQMTLYDPRERTVLGGVFSRARTGLTMFTTVDRAIAEIDDTLARYIEERYEYRPPSGVVDSIVVRSPAEGADVLFAGRNAGRITGGRLDVPYTPFPVGTVVRIDVQKDGYHPATHAVRLESEEFEISLPGIRRTGRYAGYVHSTYGAFLGLGVGLRVYAIPDQTFIALEQYRSVLPGDGPGRRGVGFTDLSVAVGQYLFLPQSSFIRLSISLGFGAIVTTIASIEDGDFVDYYLALLNPAVELNFDSWMLFVRPEARFTLGAGDNLLGRTWMRVPFGLPPITLGVVRRW
ncbi:MAG: hypothetical protein EA426_05435 [Spirochaetaceae bacterium]|nr:MAG: hypothetical protein EA426_05435 [Spirochaetaceae bacterium]